MNWFEVAFHTVGGLALFLFGMHTMSEGLKGAASNKIRQILSHLTRNRIIALLVGVAVTMLVQSSSATTVMTVGFANAGLLTFRQAISVVLGANIGTTFTAWIVSLIGTFKIAEYVLPLIAAGFVMFRFVRNKKTNHWGSVLLGFGLLFFGLDIMKDAFKPLRDSEAVVNLFAQFSENPLLGVLVGTVFTMILQSSSATIAIVQTLAFSGVISFDAALPLILGDNIGTTITAELASIGTNYNAERTARAHTLFNIIGTCIILPFVWIGVYGRFIEALLPGPIAPGNIMMHIAFAHSMFNVINALVFTIFINYLIKAANALSFTKEEPDRLRPVHLKESLLADPFTAMQQVINELVRMAHFSRKAMDEARQAFFSGDTKLIKRVYESEDVLDEFQGALTEYLIKISEEHLDTRQSMEYPVLLHSVNDLEKVGDYAANMASYADIRRDKGLTLAVEGREEIETMFAKLDELFDKVITSLESRNGSLAAQAIAIEDEIDEMKSRCRRNHIARLNKDHGHPEAEMMVMDMATNIEKVGDHLISIAKAVAKDLQWGRKFHAEEAEADNKGRSGDERPDSRYRPEGPIPSCGDGSIR